MKFMRHVPNIISIVRLLLVVPIAISIIEGNFLQSFILFTVAGLSDGLDGYLARKFGWVSTFGAIIDPVADKLLLLGTTIVLAILGHFPAMVLFLMIAKDLTVIGGILAYAMMAGFPELRPIFIGKVTTGLQLLLIGYILILLIVATAPILSTIAPIAIWIIVLATLLDGCVYIWIWTNKMTRDSRWNRFARAGV